MRTLLVAAAVLALALPRAAQAQDGEDAGAAPAAEPTPSPVPAPVPAVVADVAPVPPPEADAETTIPEPVAKQEIGARTGAQIGFPSLSAGGLRVGGLYLYRMADNTWFDGEVAFAFGSDARECYYTRAESLTLACAHGGFDGFGMSVAGGLRWFLARRASGFHPYVRTGVGLSYAGFAEDEVAGVALLGFGGAGGRFRVTDTVAVGGEALLLLGPGLYDSDLGLRLLGGMVVQLGVEFAL